MLRKRDWKDKVRKTEEDREWRKSGRRKIERGLGIGWGPQGLGHRQWAPLGVGSPSGPNVHVI